MHQSGKMQLLLSSLLLACHCTISSWSVSSDKLIVTQSPDVSVMEGNPVNLLCCWKGPFEKVKLEWEKIKILLKKDTFLSNNGCLTLAFPKIKREDSGRYVCKARVEIPLLIVDEGSGTIINVMTRDSMDNMDSSTREGVSSDKLFVTQSPDVSILEGNSVSLLCCWIGPFERVKLQWEKNQILLNYDTFPSKSGCLTLAFPNIKSDDSGRYVCKARVEIPSLIVNEGNGTIINVMTLDGMDNMDNSTREAPVLVVTQTPNVHVQEGETVMVSCCWTGRFERASVDWLKSQNKIKTEITKNRELSPQPVKKKICSSLLFSNITRDHDGTYTCRVSAGSSVMEGSGTVVTVVSSDEATPVIVPYVLRSLVILILITAFIYHYYSATKAQRQKQGTQENETTTEKQTEEA